MNKEIRKDELGLLEILDVLRRHKSLLLVLPALCAILAALVASYVISPLWEVSAVLEVGRVGQQVPSAVIPIEPVANVMSRIANPSLANEVINNSIVKSDEKAVMHKYYNTLKVTQIKGTELIEVRLKAPSAEMAEGMMLGLVASLQKVHNEMMRVSIEKYHKQLQILSEDIQQTEIDTKYLKRKLLATHNWSNFDATLMATTLQSKINDLRVLIQNKLLIQEMISPSKTYTTRVIGEVNVSEGPVSPNKTLIVEWAIVIGLLCAVVVAFARNAIATKSVA